MPEGSLCTMYTVCIYKGTDTKSLMLTAVNWTYTLLLEIWDILMQHEFAWEHIDVYGLFTERKWNQPPALVISKCISNSTYYL